MNNPPDLRAFSRQFFDLKELRTNWGWFLLLGILFIALGTIAIATSAFVTVISVILLGSMLLIGGIFQIAYAFWMREWTGFFLALLAGILYTVIGLMLTIHPAVGAVSLTLLLAAFYIVGGLFRIVGSLMMRFEMWGWALFSGIIKFALGMLIWAGWPETGLWVFGLFIGIDLLFYGWFWVLLALSARNITPKPLS